MDQLRNMWRYRRCSDALALALRWRGGVVMESQDVNFNFEVMCS